MTITRPTNCRGPILDLTLPASEDAIDLILRNKTTGEQLAINLPAEWDGTDLSLDFYRRTIKDASGADRSALLDPSDNELWVPEPLIAGANDVAIEAVLEQAQQKSPGTVETLAGGGVASWTNLSNAKTSDNTYATCALTPGPGVPSHPLITKKYGFTIPEGATIVGILAAIEHKGAGVEDLGVYVKGGVSGASPNQALASAWSESDSTALYGGATDLWGQTWTPAAINAEGLRVELEAINGTGSEVVASVDHIPLTVYYIPPSQAYTAKAKLRWEKGYY